MKILTRRIKYALYVSVQCPHDANPRKHRRPAQCRDQDQGFHGRLPFRGFVQLADAVAASGPFRTQL
jgi:hypothetical protein